MNDRADRSEQTLSSNSSYEPVSALVDGELDSGGAEFLLRRLTTDEGMHEHWQRCHLVRACLQHEFEGPVWLVGRVRTALENEAAPEGRDRMPALMRFGLGGAIAASVALLAVAGLDYRMSTGGPDPMQSQEEAGFVSQSTALDRQFNARAVPAGFGSAGNAEVRDRGGLRGRQRINRYMIRHSQAAGNTGFNSLMPVLAQPETVRLAPPVSEPAKNPVAGDSGVDDSR